MRGLDVSSLLPLKPAWFHILLTLSEQPAHGYAIRQAVESRTEGSLRLWPATLYGTLGELEDRGLIDAAGSTGPDDNVTRHFYRVTPFGRKVLLAETERLEHLARMARSAMRKRHPA